MDGNGGELRGVSPGPTGTGPGRPLVKEQGKLTYAKMHLAKLQELRKRLVGEQREKVA